MTMKDLFGGEMPELQTKKTRKEIHSDYDGFVEKFKPKKTTDDCYTPQPVYDAVLGWVRENADIEGREIVRPFYPGGDFENFDYPDGCVVVDNPPFSIFAKIWRFYVERRIAFFLFAPHLMLFGSIGVKCTGIVCGTKVTYANGVVVNTSFVSNLFEDVQIMTAPALHRAICEAQEKEPTVKLPKYRYPDNLTTAALIAKTAKYVDFKVKASECCQVSRLDCQGGKTIFGGGFLLSDRKAAELKAAGLNAVGDVIEWQLSERERQIIDKLG